MSNATLPPILVAEDDPNDLFLVQRHLNRAGVRHPVLTFADGEALTDYLLRHCVSEAGGACIRPKLLLLDIKMPRRDGFETLAWIRQQSALRDLPVVILSGSDEPGDIARAAALGANRFLTKYPPPAKFAELVQELA